MKYIKFAIIILLASAIQSCSYLDVVPDEMPEEKDAFQNEVKAKDYLYSCYSYLPKIRSTPRSLDLMTADEVVTPWEHEAFANFPKGTYSASNPQISYWNDLFGGIRQCYILIANVDGVPGLSDLNKKEYKAEAKFLIAYYHFLLLRNYGPTMIIKEALPISMPVSSYMERETYDDCVAWIANMFDEAAADLPIEQESADDYGRATSLAAKAIKARMYLYAASPLFNGNSEFYSEFKSKKDGRHLVSQTYDQNKWALAEQAAQEALDAALANGHQLYKGDENLTNSLFKQPTDKSERAARLNFIDHNSSREVIWADARREGTYDLQYKTTPYLTPGPASGNGVAVTMRFVENFYTENGLPIDKDPDFGYDGRYNFQNYDNAHAKGVTMNMNMKREPRFYAWVSFHNGYYEVIRPVGGVSSNRIKTEFRKNDIHGQGARNTDYSLTGYLNKKGASPLFAEVNLTGTRPFYPWPYVRLAELYLNLAEAQAEQGKIAQAKQNLDQVRKRAGIPTVDESWALIGETVTTKEKMVQIVRQERSIELYLEGHRFWDVRRWKQGVDYFNNKPQGLNYAGATDADFFKVNTVNVQRLFNSPANYLMPIPQKDMDIAISVLVQNPGY